MKGLIRIGSSCNFQKLTVLNCSPTDQQANHVRLVIINRSSLNGLQFVSPTSNTPAPDLSPTERQLAILVAHAISQPLRLLSQSEGSLSTYAVFWSVASREGRTQVEVASATGLSGKTVSRVVSQLGMGEGGLGLVRQMRDKNDRRLKRLILSSKGKKLRERLLTDLRNIRR